MFENLKAAGIFTLSRALLAVAALLALSVPSHSQQEVDPAWYNPWPEPNKTVAQRPKPGPAANHEKEKKITATNSRPNKKRPSEQGAQVRQSPKQVATAKSPNPR